MTDMDELRRSLTTEMERHQRNQETRKAASTVRGMKKADVRQGEGIGISREDAKRRGLVAYRSAKPCPEGHDVRWMNGQCTHCPPPSNVIERWRPPEAAKAERRMRVMKADARAFHAMTTK
jgi:hypothetical protein